MLIWIPIGLASDWLLRRLGVGGEGLPSLLAAWALRVALPATVLKVLADLPLARLLHPAVWLPWILLLPLAFLVKGLLARLAFLNPDQRRLLLLLGILGNTSFLGLPLLQAVMGEAALAPALLYDQFGSFPQLLLLGTLILEQRAQGAQKRGSAALRRLLAFPPLPALLLALSPWGLPLKNLLMPLLGQVSWTLVPVVMLSLGGRLQLKLDAGDRPALALGLAVKMLLAPVLLLALVWLMGLRHTDLPVVLLESAMPPMATAAAWAADRHCAPALAAALVSVGIGLALLWIPFLAWLFPRVLP